MMNSTKNQKPTLDDVLNWLGNGLWPYTLAEFMQYTHNFTENNSYRECLEWLFQDPSRLNQFILEFSLEEYATNKESLIDYLCSEDVFDSFDEATPIAAESNKYLIAYITLINTLQKNEKIKYLLTYDNSQSLILDSQHQECLVLLYEELDKYKKMLEERMLGENAKCILGQE